MAEFTPITTQEEFDAAISTRLEREHKKYEGYLSPDDVQKKYADYMSPDDCLQSAILTVLVTEAIKKIRENAGKSFRANLIAGEFHPGFFLF